MFLLCYLSCLSVEMTVFPPLTGGSVSIKSGKKGVND